MTDQQQFEDNTDPDPQQFDQEFNDEFDEDEEDEEDEDVKVDQDNL